MSRFCPDFSLKIYQKSRFFTKKKWKAYLKFIHRIESGNVPEVLVTKLIITRKAKHNRALRSNDLYQLPNAKKSSTQNSLFYKGIKIYNDFRAKNRDELHKWNVEKIYQEMQFYVKSNFE